VLRSALGLPHLLFSPLLPPAQLRILERERALAAKAAETASAHADVFGELPIIQSRSLTGRVWTRVDALCGSLAASRPPSSPPLLVRARLAGVRDTARFLFLTLRQGMATVQAVAPKAPAAAAALAKFLLALPRESIVDFQGALAPAEQRVLSVSQGDVELHVAAAHVVSRAAPLLPFSLEDVRGRAGGGRRRAAASRRIAACARAVPPPPALPPSPRRPRAPTPSWPRGKRRSARPRRLAPRRRRRSRW